MKHFRGKIFGFSPVANSLHNVGVHALEVDLIKVGKAGGILLRSFDQKPLVRFFLQSFLRILRGLAVHKGNALAARKVTGRKNSALEFLT